MKKSRDYRQEKLEALAKYNENRKAEYMKTIPATEEYNGAVDLANYNANKKENVLLMAAKQLVHTCDTLASNGVKLPLSIVDCYESAKMAIADTENA